MAKLSTDSLLEVVGDLRRRHVIECLRDNGSMTVTDLADAVAVMEYEQPIGKVSEKAIDGVHLTLLHSHLPKLESAEAVVYDRSGDTVIAGATFEQAVGMLDAVEDGHGRVT